MNIIFINKPLERWYESRLNIPEESPHLLCKCQRKGGSAGWAVEVTVKQRIGGAVSLHQRCTLYRRAEWMEHRTAEYCQDNTQLLSHSLRPTLLGPHHGFFYFHHRCSDADPARWPLPTALISGYLQHRCRPWYYPTHWGSVSLLVVNLLVLLVDRFGSGSCSNPGEDPLCEQRRQCQNLLYWIWQQ